LLNPTEVQEKEVLETLESRRKIRGSLIEWARYCGFEPAAHHRLLIKELEDLALGKNDRLAIFMPPGSAKSTYSSILFASWYMGRFPDHALIAASNTAELAQRFGRRVRNLVNGNSPVLGIGLSSDSGAQGRWETDGGGEYFASGLEGGIAGRRADLAIIDDPLRSREDAESELIREKQWQWYLSDLHPRLKPNAKIVLIQTRWHEDDLAGRILGSGEDWRVISLPAEAEENDPLGRKPGEWLWADDSYGYAGALIKEKKIQSPRNWISLFQQRPAPEDGDYFKSDWLKPYSKLPPLETLSVYGASDWAVTQDGGDFTVHIVVGIDPDGQMYVLDLWRKQTSSEVWVDTFCDLVLKWKPIEWAEEQGQIKAGVGPFLDRRQRERQAFVYRRAFPVRADKAVRAQSIRGRMALNGLYVPNAGWYPTFRAELMSFPSGKHDDQVDALGLVGQLLDTIMVGQKPKTPDKKKFYTGYISHQRPALDDWIKWH
jgi:predicted phage terminase large subunit-like protein